MTAKTDHPGAAETSRAGFVALAGAPNVGKSTLLNRILGRPLSIATPRPQTTRNRVLGIHTHGHAQLVFADTPGIHTASGLIHERMVGSARKSVRSADVTCWIIDAAKGLTSVDREEAERLAAASTVVVFNKIDTIDQSALLPLIQRVTEILPEAECLPVSAVTGEGVNGLLDVLARTLPEGDWLYDGDTLTDQNERFFVAELVREQLFMQLTREMPYRVAVRVDAFEERRKNTFIAATVFTNSDSSKKIIVGRGGARIREVGTAARRRIEELLERRVYLELYVKVRKGWHDDARFLEELGI